MAKILGLNGLTLTAVAIMTFLVPDTSASYICSRRWQHLLEHGPSGSEIYGSKASLKQAAIEGAPLRVYINNVGGTGLLLNEDLVAFILQDNICIESLKHMSRLDWKTFTNDSYWQFIQICTTGDFQTFFWQYGTNSSAGSSLEHVTASWYAQYNGCKDGEGNMILTSFPNGTSADGNIPSILSAVAEGAELTAYDSFTGKRLPMKSVTWETGLLVGHNQWAFSDHMAGNHREFDSWPSWLFSLWTTGGLYKDVHWQLKDNSIARANRSVELKWYADPCWQLAYSHDTIGNSRAGSLAFLRSAVSKGHRVKIIMGNFSAEADDVLLEADHVTAVITSDVSHSFVHMDDFGQDIYWLFRIVSTAGISKIFLFDIVTPTTGGVYHDSRSISWYIDTRPWKHVLSVDERGTVVKGSKINLLNAVTNGADVRLSRRHGSLWTSFQKADSVILNGTEMAFETIRSLEVLKDPQDGFHLPYHPAWTFSLFTTHGEIDISKWTVTQHESRGHYRLNTAIDWYVNY